MRRRGPRARSRGQQPGSAHGSGATDRRLVRGSPGPRRDGGPGRRCRDCNGPSAATKTTDRRKRYHYHRTVSSGNTSRVKPLAEVPGQAGYLHSGSVASGLAHGYAEHVELVPELLADVLLIAALVISSTTWPEENWAGKPLTTKRSVHDSDKGVGLGSASPSPTRGFYSPDTAPHRQSVGTPPQ